MMPLPSRASERVVLDYSREVRIDAGASLRLNTDVIVDGVTEPLFAPEVTLSRLYAHVTQ